MNNASLNKVMIFITFSIVASATICALIFNTTFAKNTIDYFSFFAALFLVTDGTYKIRRYREEAYFPHQLVRQLRIIFGACIFTIHLLQYVYGV